MDQDAGSDGGSERSHHSTRKKDVDSQWFGWFRELYSIDDVQIFSLKGQDVLFYLKYEKYCAILFFMMSLCNIPVILIYYKSSFDNTQIKIDSYLQRFTVTSLIDIQKGGDSVISKSNDKDKIFLWATLILFIFHLLLQHMCVIIYHQECRAWKNQNVSEAAGKAQQNLEKSIMDNSLVIYGLNQGDDPKKINKFLRMKLEDLINDTELISQIAPHKDKAILKKKYDELNKLGDQSHMPMFSIHIPSDYNSVSYLIDEYEDSQKIADFCLKKIKQIQVDNRPNDKTYQKDPTKALIPFCCTLEKGRQRRMIEKQVLIENGWQTIHYCELNYQVNSGRQILKMIREKSSQVEERNTGFGFIYFNDFEDKLLKRLFVKNFYRMIKEHKAIMKQPQNQDTFIREKFLSNPLVNKKEKLSMI